MALNKNLNSVALKDESAYGKTPIRNEAYAPSVVAQAQNAATPTTTPTTTSGSNGAYNTGKNFWSNILNGAQNSINKYKKAEQGNQYAIRYGQRQVGEFLRGATGGKSLGNPYLEMAENVGNSVGASTSTTPTTTPTTPSSSQTTGTTNTANNTGALSGSPANDNPYSDYLKNERSYQLQQLDNERNNAVQRARLAYQKAINPYGVQAEALASSGLSPNGGYGQRMQTARYNAYADALNAAQNSHFVDRCSIVWYT